MNSLAMLRTVHRVSGLLAPGLTARSASYLLRHPRQHPPRDWERVARAEAEPVSFRFGHRGLRWGNRGPIVLALHGWEGRATQFAHFLPVLREAGLQVIALEGPGHAPGDASPANPVTFAHALMSVADDLGEPVSVLAHSMGAAATTYALTQGLEARRVALLAGPSSYAGVLDRFADALGLPARSRPYLASQAEGELGVSMASLELGRATRVLTTPALLVHDHDDAVVPAHESEALAAHWPHARLVLTQGLGHWRVMTDPQVIRQVGDWLQQPVM